jgi:hypothetical protein
MLPEWKPPRPKREPLRKLAKLRIGPRMRELQAITSACPGITKAAALRAADLPDRGMGAYRPVNRAIAAGLVIAEQSRRCGPYMLFSSESDRELFHLRERLLHGQLSPAEADELVGQIENLRQQQMMEFAEAQGRASGEATQPTRPDGRGVADHAAFGVSLKASARSLPEPEVESSRADFGHAADNATRRAYEAHAEDDYGWSAEDKQG